MLSRRAPIVALAFALAVALSACGGPGAAPPTAPATVPTAAPTTAPTEAPTAAPTVAPTEAATVAPTEAPTAAPGAVLPRPLYTLQAGQIFRIETDGTTRTQITDEVPFRPDAVAVTEFAVSPADGSLVYIVQREGTSVLVRSGPDGQDPAPLFDDETVGPNQPLFTPDGQFVAARLAAPYGPEQTFTNGLYLLPVDGGEPQLLVADEAAANGIEYGHGPATFSPDGARLLTYRFALSVEQCDLAVVSVPDGAAIPVQVPPIPEGERVTTCGSAAWAEDGSAIYYTPIRIGAGEGNTAIWQASPTTGESFPITPQPEASPLTLYAFPGVAADGTLLAFVTQADELPVPFAEQPDAFAYAIARVDRADGTATELRPAEPENPALVLWDEDGRGAVALRLPEVGDPGLWWLPADGGEAVLLLGATTDLSSYRWAAR